ncbi:MAG: hypothetical protein J6N15_01150 [Ruminiclostridium sp.]|nr:hypothetical protein [Ruminiclostridium sp.]
MKLKVSAILLVLCMIFGGCVPHTDSVSAYGQSLTTGTVPTQLPEIEPNPDDAAAAETVAAVIVIILVVCVVIYICDSSN